MPHSRDRHCFCSLFVCLSNDLPILVLYSLMNFLCVSADVSSQLYFRIFILLVFKIGFLEVT